MTATTGLRGIARGSTADLMGLVYDVALPTLGKGVLRRRPAVVGVLERTGIEERGIRRLQRLREKYDSRAVLLSVFGRTQLIPTDPAQVTRILNETPEHYYSTSDEKSSALAHFEPGVSLTSNGADRVVQRKLNAQILDEGCVMHQLAEQFRSVIEEEFGELLRGLEKTAEGRPLAWPPFFKAWNRLVRTVLLGKGARDDETLTEMLNKLRSTGNWAFLPPKREGLRDEFHTRLQSHLDRADPASLAGRFAQCPHDDRAQPVDQFTHFMFAFDPAGMTTFRTLALLASHDDTLRQWRSLRSGNESAADQLLRASLLESLRLWSTTPVILRQARRDLDWDGDILPEGTQIIIYAPFFHRDDQTLDEADRFTPGLWPEGRVLRNSRFLPFSEGDGICPARDMVLMVGAMVLDEVLRTHNVQLTEPDRLDPMRPLPPTLDNYTLEFMLSPRAKSDNVVPLRATADDRLHEAVSKGAER